MDLDKIELTEGVRIQLREKQGELVRVITAFESLEKSKEWETLTELVFKNSLASIERQILNEALSKEINTGALYKLQGEWVWAKQYNEPERFISTLKQQLEGIKNKLK